MIPNYETASSRIRQDALTGNISVLLEVWSEPDHLPLVVNIPESSLITATPYILNLREKGDYQSPAIRTPAILLLIGGGAESQSCYVYDPVSIDVISNLTGFDMQGILDKWATSQLFEEEEA